jgi:hypothetical protein
VIEQRPPLLLRLKLLLRDVHPAVWRRFKLADSLSIADLHRVIQLLMGWDEDHLHRFCIHGPDYGIAHVGGPSEPGLASNDDTVAGCRARPSPAFYVLSYATVRHALGP